MRKDSHSDIFIIGHRGCRDLRPENTIAAFKYALELGVDGVECDVHLTKDRKVVVYHDYFLNPDLTRTSTGDWIEHVNKPIHQQTYDALKSYKLGKIKPGTEYAKRHPHAQNVEDQTIPSLQDVIKLMKQYPKQCLLIEIKTTPFNPEESSDPTMIAKVVVEEINKADFKDHCEVLAFDWRVMELVKGLDPQIKLSFNHVKLSDHNSKRFAGYEMNEFQDTPYAIIARMGGSTWSAQYEQLTKQNIKEAHDLGLSVYAWTVNSEKDMQDLLDKGVDAIISDRPDLAISVLKKT